MPLAQQVSLVVASQHALAEVQQASFFVQQSGFSWAAFGTPNRRPKERNSTRTTRDARPFPLAVPVKGAVLADRGVHGHTHGTRAPREKDFVRASLALVSAI
jgi:hypothetical protein